MAVDLVKTPAFERAKRAMQIFSSALFLLAISTEAATIKPEALGATVTISTASLQLVLWVVSTYYLIIFWVEYRSAVTLNSEGLARAPGATIDARMQGIEDSAANISNALLNLRTPLENLEIIANATVHRIQGAVDRLNQSDNIEEWKNRVLAEMAANYNVYLGDEGVSVEVISKAMEKVVKDCLLEPVIEIGQSVRNFSASYSKDIDTTGKLIIGLHRETIDGLSAIKKDISTVSRDITTGQRFVFRWLDFWASVALYALATIGTVIDQRSAMIAFAATAINLL